MSPPPSSPSYVLYLYLYLYLNPSLYYRVWVRFCLSYRSHRRQATFFRVYAGNHFSASSLAASLVTFLLLLTRAVFIAHLYTALQAADFLYSYPDGHVKEQLVVRLRLVS
jgi:hypothetical protein